MKFAYAMLSILVTLFLVSGCSEEKPDNHEDKNIARNVVRKAVQKPVKKTQIRKEPRKEVADIANTGLEQEMTQKTIKEQSPPVQETEKEEVIPIQEANIYITREGDTLSGISEKTNIYNNPLKWFLLYRDNPEALSSIKDKDNLFETNLPAGIKFKIIPEVEVEKTLENKPGNYYAANLISSPYMKEIAPQVVRLIDAGYFVYITSTMIDGKEWYRLRAGFYKTRSEANREGDKIKNHLNIPDIWTAKVGERELHDFGGY